jgi:hypothetical protein
MSNSGSSSILKSSTMDGHNHQQEEQLHQQTSLETISSGLLHSGIIKTKMIILVSNVSNPHSLPVYQYADLDADPAFLTNPDPDLDSIPDPNPGSKLANFFPD